MKKTLLIWTLFMVAFGPNFLIGQSSPYPEDEIIIKFTEGTSTQTQIDIINQMGATVIDEDDDGNMLLNIPSFPVTVNGNVYSSVVEIIEGVDNNAEIDDTDLNYTVSSTPLGYTELFSSLDMEEYSPIPEGCLNDYPGTLTSTTPKMGKIRMAIVDTGIDLEGHGWMAPFVVDGVSIVTNNSDLYDGNGHGTSVAGIITGMAISAGLTPDELELYIVQVLDHDGTASLFDVIKGVKAASNFLINAMNVSWSYVPIIEDGESQILHGLMQKMSNQQNIIIVAGAGNDGEDISFYDCAPANFSGIDYLVTVGGVNCDGTHAEWSNYSEKIVEIGAPFESIICPTLNGNWISGHSGTSFSAAIVSAAIVQTWSTYFSSGVNSSVSDFSKIIDILFNTAINHSPLSDHVNHGRVLDVGAACWEAYNIARNESHYFSSITVPSSINDLKVYQKTDSSSNLTPSIYPNPVKNKMRVNLNNPLCKKTQVEIWDIVGNKYYEHRFLNNNCINSFEVELNPEMPDGVYVLKIFQEGISSNIIFVNE
jgi:hypothetical protein